ILLYCDLLSAGLEDAGSETGRLENRGLANFGLEANQLRQHVEEVRMASQQGAALTHQLLAIARKQAADPRPILINDIVATTENLLRRLIGEPIQLVILLDSALDSGAERVLADPAQLRQVLMNLVLNARDAMPHGGTITLSTRAAEFPGEASSGVSSKAEPGSA